MITKERIQEAIVSAAITFIVTVMGIKLFGIGASIYAGITAGLCVSVGKEYGDSLNKENHWEWRDILFGIIGTVTGVLAACLLIVI